MDNTKAIRRVAICLIQHYLCNQMMRSPPRDKSFDSHLKFHQAKMPQLGCVSYQLTWLQEYDNGLTTGIQGNTHKRKDEPDWSSFQVLQQMLLFIRCHHYGSNSDQTRTCGLQVCCLPIELALK
ncbi:uncharacterized protein LOC117323647 [Pecten maximus]|uniref:uncharacterized protein LOC117323647 n=1 Tax=Pecten maximus TaxID=6579 RepID=UPI0014585C85|nr:uncharacterized protein LOC117323647 [Pecten maximus]XP_033734866.1 uncharacterized protein LOC117323647 [Pecten maximus]